METRSIEERLAEAEATVEQLQGELQHWKDCYNGAEKARSEEQAAHSQRIHQMEHRAEQAEAERDSALRGEKFQRELQESRLRDLIKAEAQLAIILPSAQNYNRERVAKEQAEARVKDLERWLAEANDYKAEAQKWLMTEPNDAAMLETRRLYHKMRRRLKQAEAALATATARVEKARQYAQHKEFCDIECLMEDEYPSCTCGLMEAVAEPKEQG